MGPKLPAWTGNVPPRTKPELSIIWKLGHRPMWNQQMLDPNPNQNCLLFEKIVSGPCRTKRGQTWTQPGHTDLMGGIEFILLGFGWTHKDWLWLRHIRLGHIIFGGGHCCFIGECYLATVSCSPSPVVGLGSRHSENSQPIRREGHKMQNKLFLGELQEMLKRAILRWLFAVLQTT